MDHEDESVVDGLFGDRRVCLGAAGTGRNIAVAVPCDQRGCDGAGVNREDQPIGLGAHRPWTGESTLHVWDWSKGPASRVLKVACSTGMALSPDGKWIVMRDGRVIDAASGEAKAMPGMEKDVRGLRFSPDGKGLLVIRAPEGAAGATATMFDFPDGRKRFEIADVWPHTIACAFTADSGEVLLMNKDKIIQRLEWEQREGGGAIRAGV